MRSSKPTKLTLSGQIREVILDRGLTGYELAEKAELNRSIVNRFLAGSPASGETLDALADVLGLKLVEPTRRVTPGRGNSASRRRRPFQVDREGIGRDQPGQARDDQE